MALKSGVEKKDRRLSLKDVGKNISSFSAKKNIERTATKKRVAWGLPPKCAI